MEVEWEIYGDFRAGSSFIDDYHSEYLDVSTSCLNDLVFAISAVLRRLCEPASLGENREDLSSTKHTIDKV